MAPTSSRWQGLTGALLWAVLMWIPPASHPCFMTAKSCGQKKRRQRCIRQKASQEMIRLLEGVVQSGTARRLGQNSQVPRAGKTGTTNDNKDGWFCCMIPDYTVSVWVGCDNPQRVPGLSGGNYPLTIVKGVIEQLDDAPKVTNFAAFQKTIAEEDLTFSKEVGAYDSYLPGRDDAEELSPRIYGSQLPTGSYAGRPDRRAAESGHGRDRCVEEERSHHSGRSTERADLWPDSERRGGDEDRLCKRDNSRKK